MFTGDPYTAILRNTIVTENSAENGLNVFGALSNSESNLIDIDAMLGPLADNGGPTPTHALLTGSPAIDTGFIPDTRNVALNGTATQSTPGGVIGSAANAINGSFASSSRTSSFDSAAFWQIVLEGDQPIEKIILHNSIFESRSRLRDITVQVLDTNDMVLHTSPLLNPENILGGGVVNEGPATLTVDFIELFGSPLTGRKVIISRTADPDYSGIGGPGMGEAQPAEANVLALAEVEIFANFVDDLPTTDQRGLTRFFNDSLDIGAYEVQPIPSTDFDTDGDVDGADFLIWQRGFGTLNAEPSDGDANNDTEVSADDLTIWRNQFGNPVPGSPLAAASIATEQLTFHNLFSTASIQSESLNDSRSELIDVAIALSSTVGNRVPAASPPDKNSFIGPVQERVFTPLDLNAVLTYEQSQQSLKTTETDGSDATADPWLSNELLELVFG